MENKTKNFSDPELEQSLQDQHQKIRSDVELEAKHYAKENRPYLKGDCLDNYVSKFLILFDEMIVRINHTLRPETCQAEIKALRKFCRESMKALKQKLQEIETQINNLELEIKKNNEGGMVNAESKDKYFHLILVVIGVAEVAFTTSALQLLGYTLLFSFLISLGITGALFFLAKNLAKHMKESDQARPKKIMLAGGITLLVLSIFYFLAELRSEQLKEQSQYDISPFFLLGVNILFFIVTFWHFFRNTSHKSDILLRERQALIKKTHAELLEKKEELEGQIEQLNEETESKVAMLLQKPEYVKWMAERAKKWKEEIVALFIATNLAFRTDRRAPDFYSNSKKESLTS